MVHLILESLFKVVCMGMVFINDQMENTMKAIGLTIKCPIKGNQSGRMEENTLVNTVKIKSMGKAYLNELMEGNILASGEMESSMERGSFSLLKGKGGREFGRMGGGLGGLTELLLIITINFYFFFFLC